MSIKSYRCSKTEAFYTKGKRVKEFIHFERVAMRKLQQIDAATTLDFLRTPPGNHLEALQGDRAGQYSIRINSQYRICFVWQDGANNVEIVDYHS